MPATRLQLTGKRFGFLVALEITSDSDSRRGGIIWRCLCDCGGQRDVRAAMLNSGQVTHCGCRSGVNRNLKKLSACDTQTQIYIEIPKILSTIDFYLRSYRYGQE